MNTSGEAADQVVRMVLEGTEYVVKLSGKGAVQLGALVYSIARQQKKTKGAERLTNMLRNGKALKVYTFDAKDLTKFKEVANQYGVLYTILKEKERSDGVFDVLVRAEDDSKIARIVERFKLVRVDSASIRADVVREKAEREQAETEKTADGDKPAEPEQETPEKSYEDRVLDELEKKPTNGEKAEPENPTAARTEVSPERTDGVPSEPKSEAEPSAPSHRENGEPEFRPSVKKKIRQMEERKRTARAEQKTAKIPVPDATKTVPVKPKER